MGVVFRQSLKGTIVNLFGAGLGFVTTFFVVTRLLSPAEIGLTRVLVEAATLVSGYALLATNSSAIRYYPYFRTDDGRDKGFFRLIILIPFIGVLLFGGLYLLFREPLIQYFSPDDGGDHLFRSYYYVVLPLTLFILYQTVLEVYCSLRQRIVVPKMSREVLLRLLLLVAYVAYGVRWIDFDQFVMAFVLSYGLMVLFTLGYSRRLAPQAWGASLVLPSRKVRQDFRRYTLFTVLSAMGSSIVQRLDLFMVSAQMGMASAGIYTIAFYVVAVIEMPSRSLVAISSPLASVAIHSGDIGELNRIYRQVSNYQLLVGAILFLAIWVNIDLLFWLIPNGDIYAVGKGAVLFLGLGKLIDLAFSFGNAILRYSKYYFWTLVYTIVVMGVNILLNLYLIEKWGLSGAAIATLVSFGVSYLFQQIVLWWKLRISPISMEMAWIVMIFGLLVGVNHFLPHWGSVIVDCVWRSLVIGIFGWLMMRRLETFGGLMSQLGGLVKGKRERRK